METVLAFAAILGAAYFVIIISAAFVTALKKSPAPAVAINSSQMVKIKYRRNHWNLIASTLEDTNWNLRTLVVYLVKSLKSASQRNQKHHKNYVTSWSATSLMRGFYRSKRTKVQLDGLLIFVNNNFHLLTFLYSDTLLIKNCVDSGINLISDCENCCSPINVRETVEFEEVVCNAAVWSITAA